jgi:hypothetical protein
MPLALCGSSAGVLTCSKGCTSSQELEHVAACQNLAFVGAEAHEPADDDAATSAHVKGESVLHFTCGCFLIGMCIQKTDISLQRISGCI